MLSAIVLATSMLAPRGADGPLIVAPHLPSTAQGGGEVLLHVKLDASGTPELIAGLLDAPPFGEALRQAVRQWRWRGDESQTARDVLVAGVFRSPALLELRSLPDPPPAATAPREIPFPIEWARPPYPVDALGDGIVIVAMRIDEDGVACDTRVVHSAPAFEAAALGAAARWKFRPAARDGRPAPAVVYVVFGFRSPVIPASRAPGEP